MSWGQALKDLKYRRSEGEAFSCSPNNNLNCKSFGKLRNVPEGLDNFDLIYSGGRIYF